MVFSHSNVWFGQWAPVYGSWWFHALSGVGEAGWIPFLCECA
jgi:hypothetical protein